MQYEYGKSQSGLPAQDRKLWISDGWFEAPTLKGITDMVFNIVGNVTVQSWLGFLDDVVFGLLDITSEGKDPKEVGLELAKKTAVLLVTSGIGSVSNKVSDAVSALDNTAGRIIFSGLNAGLTNYSQSAASSAINSVYLTSDGHLAFDAENFSKSLYSREILAGAVSGMAGRVVSQGLGTYLTIDGNKMELNEKVFNLKGINSFSSIAGSGTASLVEYGITGKTTINLLNTGIFGLTDLKGKELNKGLFEMTFSKNKGISGRIGSGGNDMNIASVLTAFGGVRDALKITDAKVSSLFGKQEKISTMNAINMLGYTGFNDNIRLANDIWDDRLSVNYADTRGDWGNYKDGEAINISQTLLGGGAEDSAKLATVLAHEGSHVYGNHVEGIAHSVGLETYAQINRIFGLAGESSFAGEMIDAIIDKNSWKENTGDTDHWTVRTYADGRHELIYDNQKTKY